MDFHPYVRVMSRLPGEVARDVPSQASKDPYSLICKHGLLDPTSAAFRKFGSRFAEALEKEVTACVRSSPTPISNKLLQVIQGQCYDNYLDAAVFECMWLGVGRPFYNVWPIVYETKGLLQNFRLTEITWQDIPMQFSPLVLRFPAGREPFGIKCMTLQRNPFTTLDNVKEVALKCGHFLSGAYAPRSTLKSCGVETRETSPEGYRRLTFDNQDYLVSMSDLQKGALPEPLLEAMTRAGMTDDPRHLGEAFALGERVEQNYFSLHRRIHDCNDIYKAQMRTDEVHLRVTSLIANSGASPLEGEIQWLDGGKLPCRFMILDAQPTDSIESCIEATRVRYDLIWKCRQQKKEGIASVDVIEAISKGDLGGHLDITGPYTTRQNPQVGEFVVRLAAFVSMLDQGNDLLTPVILKRDENSYAEADAARRRFLEERAARNNGGLGWHIGREMQSDHENGLRSPHYVAPFLRMQPHGKDSALRKLITVAGHFRGVNHLSEVPTGFEGEEQPKPVEYRFRPSLPSRVRYLIMRRDAYTCQLCGKKREDGVTLEVDHKVPVKRGGVNDPHNLWVLCNVCNNGKSTLSLDPHEP
jgi:hypothetical protein